MLLRSARRQSTYVNLSPPMEEKPLSMWPATSLRLLLILAEQLAQLSLALGRLLSGITMVVPLPFFPRLSLPCRSVR